jgi:hypothetical protein
VDIAAQQVAQQQLMQAQQMFMQVAQAVVSLGDQFPDIKSKTDQLGAAVMQLLSDVAATLQATPQAPPM